MCNSCIGTQEALFYVKLHNINTFTCTHAHTPLHPVLAGWHWLIHTDRGGEHGGGRCSRRAMWEVLQNIRLLVICRIRCTLTFNVSVTLWKICALKRSHCSASVGLWWCVAVLCCMCCLCTLCGATYGLRWHWYYCLYFVVFALRISALVTHRYQTCMMSHWLMGLWALRHTLRCGFSYTHM